jgi:hypothetical protein
MLGREPYSQDIQEGMVSFDNLKDNLTNVDFKLMGTNTQQIILEESVEQTWGKMMHTFCDNGAVMSWQQKGRTAMEKVAAYLLQEAAICQHKHDQHYNTSRARPT